MESFAIPAINPVQAVLPQEILAARPVPLDIGIMEEPVISAM